MIDSLVPNGVSANEVLGVITIIYSTLNSIIHKNQQIDSVW